MTRSIRPLVAGNWKMNGLQSVLAEFDLMGAGNDVSIRRSVDLMICPPATLISALAHAAIGQGIMEPIRAIFQLKCLPMLVRQPSSLVTPSAGPIMVKRMQVLD